jgi:hypothetical protein
MEDTENIIVTSKNIFFKGLDFMDFDKFLIIKKSRKTMPWFSSGIASQYSSIHSISVKPQPE